MNGGVRIGKASTVIKRNKVSVKPKHNLGKARSNKASPSGGIKRLAGMNLINGRGSNGKKLLKFKG